MLTYFKNLFRKKHGAHETAAAPSAGLRSAASDISVPMQRVETASLQLLAIMAKFPDDLRQYVSKLPPPEAMVALPLPTILKFLPSGSVKMSLASVVRQAPPGTFTAMPAMEKRGVEVPLAEIFKRVSPAILKKRDDQRYTELADDGFDIFGDEENPYALAPRVGESSPSFKPSVAPSSVIRPAPSSVIRPAQRVVQMPDMGMVAAPPPEVAALAPAPAPSSVAAPASGIVPPLKLTPGEIPAPQASEPPTPPVADDQPPLVLALKDLLAAWPEPIKSEAIALNGATVALPSAELSSGLAKGKVAFQWGQIRAWLTPPPATPTGGNEATELSLPLRVVAPAFLKHSKKEGAPKKTQAIDESIPALFSGGKEPAPVAPAAPAPAAEAAPAPVVAEAAPVVATPAPEAQPPVAAPIPTAPVLEIAAEAPATPAAPVEPAVEEASAPAKKGAQKGGKKAPELKLAEPPAPVVAEAPAPAPAAEPSAPTAAKPQAQSLGELFNDPAKTSWSPTELIAAMLANLPEVDGAIVALQEGLVVAHQLPESFKGDVFAAFLPQLFARLNQYSGEMKLGTVNDLLLNAEGRQCQLFRVGQIFFGVLAKPNQTLPSHALRLCAHALAE